MSEVFPIRHFFLAMRDSFLGNLTTPAGTRVFPFDPTDVLIVAAWGIAGLAVAVRTFSWEPRK